VEYLSAAASWCQNDFTTLETFTVRGHLPFGQTYVSLRTKPDKPRALRRTRIPQDLKLLRVASGLYATVRGVFTIAWLYVIAAISRFRQVIPDSPDPPPLPTNSIAA
jgi:hypothetical protein